MAGLIFEYQAQIAPSAPNRMDIALFVGFMRARSGVSLPLSIRQWLFEQGWTAKPYARPLEGLRDLPIPIEDWNQFDALFQWDQRTTDSRDGATYMGAAVRSFFAQGGRKCYVVRVGDPWPLEHRRDDRRKAIAQLIPGYPTDFLPSSADRFSWSGVGHLFGLPDVSLVCLPDLADAVATDRVQVPIPDPPPASPEEFVECSVPAAPAPPDRTVRNISAPRCDRDGFTAWADAVTIVTNTLRNRQREVQMIAALPMPVDQLAFDSLSASAFVQVAYPWTRTPGSVGLPEQLESPDGVLTGILARNALVQGTFRSAANRHLADVYDLQPMLDSHQQEQDRLIERVSLFGPTPAGLRLLSDVTMSSTEIYRPGCVSRLVATITRTARRLGEEVTFDPSGEQLWSDIRARLNALMRGLYQAGAFVGATPAEAYQVRCDRSTMNQNDIDNGRVIAYVTFDSAAPVDTITVALLINQGGPVALVQSEAA